MHWESFRDYLRIGGEVADFQPHTERNVSTDFVELQRRDRARLHCLGSEEGGLVATPTHTTHAWRFGVFEVDAPKEELCRAGVPIKLREQSFRILVYLLAHAGETVTREELRRVLWPADTFVDFDHSLNTAVMKLREALGDTADKPLYIETIPKRGYRFVAPVVPVNRSGDGRLASITDQVSELHDTNQAVSSGGQRIFPRALRYGAIATAGLTVLTFMGILLFIRAKHSGSPKMEANRISSTLPVVPITSGPGDAILPVLSPDEKWIAYLWNGPERNYQNVYLQLLGSGLPLRLTQNKFARLGVPAWSPDGTELAFTRCDGRDNGVFAVPSAGGTERKLSNGGCWAGGGPCC